jgi:hypothetical protein
MSCNITFVAGAGFEPATSGTCRARDVQLRKGLESAGSTLVSREITRLVGAILVQPRWRRLGVAGPVGTESVAFLLRGSNHGGAGRTLRHALALAAELAQVTDVATSNRSKHLSEHMPHSELHRRRVRFAFSRSSKMVHTVPNPVS